jgi:DNA-binding NarL/FixJ family response regulator
VGGPPMNHELVKSVHVQHAVEDHFVLTSAESRVLELVALGLSTSEIAKQLYVCRQTITYHISNLLMKSGARNRTGLVAKAYSVGVLDIGTWPPQVPTGTARQSWDTA